MLVVNVYNGCRKLAYFNLKLVISFGNSAKLLFTHMSVRQFVGATLPQFFVYADAVYAAAV